jgi:hypothetical protein
VHSVGPAIRPKALWARPGPVGNWPTTSVQECARSRRSHHTRCAHGGALVGLQQESPREVPSMVAGRGTHPLGGVTVRVEVMAYNDVHWRRVGSGGW